MPSIYFTNRARESLNLNPSYQHSENNLIWTRKVSQWQKEIGAEGSVASDPISGEIPENYRAE